MWDKYDVIFWSGVLLGWAGVMANAGHFILASPFLLVSAIAYIKGRRMIEESEAKE